MSLECDNTATIAMLEEPGWRTRYISIYGEAARQEMFQHTMVVTYVSTDKQLADPLTKPRLLSIPTFSLGGNLLDLSLSADFASIPSTFEGEHPI